MKLLRCVYPDAKCCGAAAVKQTFNQLWYAMDGRLDQHNIDMGMFGAGLSFVSPGHKVGADSPFRQDKKVVWTYAPKMGNLPRFEEDCSKPYADRGGMAVVLRDGKTFDIVEDSKVEGCTWTPAYRFEPGVGLYLYYGAYKALLDQTGITADRTFELPDQSGTIALTSDITGGGGDLEVIEADGVQAGITGTTLDTAIESITILAAQINTPGKRIRCEFYVSYEGASAKTIRLKWSSSTKVTIAVAGGAGQAFVRWTLGVSETGASGVVYHVVEVTDFLNGVDYKETDNFTTDTTANQSVSITGQLTDSGDDMDLKWYVVEAV